MTQNHEVHISSDVSLKKRLRVSLSIGIVFFAALIIAFVAIRNGPEIDGAQVPARKAFEFNEKVFSALMSDRPSVAKAAPPPGTLPRVNGDLGMPPLLNLDELTYEVEVSQEGRTEKLNFPTFKAWERRQVITDFKCVEGWSRVIQYAGVPFSTFMERSGFGRKPDGTTYKYVGLETPDGEYYVSLDMASMLHPQTLLAYEMNDAPLLPENGAPLRLIIPIKYGIKSLKRIGKISFSDERPPDYWAEEGYDWYSGL